jgi:O-6-methylguanine DNA methyltransferase
MDDTRKPDQLDDGLAQDEGGSAEMLDQMIAVARTRLTSALKRIKRPAARIGVATTALGPLLVAESPRGIVTVKFLDSRDGEVALGKLRLKFDLELDQALAARIGAEIDRFLDGDLDAIARRRIDLSLVDSEFQRRAFKRLRQVPPGSVVTYQSLAAAIGAPSSQRAIGNTMASNPIPIYVPCHRVIRSGGTIGKYGGGVERKLQLLRAEGFNADRGRRIPTAAVYGHWVSRIFCRPACSAVRRADRKRWIIFADPAHARGAGLRPCKLCRPA